MSENHIGTEYVVNYIRQAVEKAKAQGILIRPGSYGLMILHGDRTYVHRNPQYGVCPMGACLIGSKANSLYGDDAATLLGVSELWVRGFTMGFDMTPEPEVQDPVLQDGYAIGHQFRAELLPE